MSTGKYIAEKVLSIKKTENGNKIVLIQWEGCTIQQATWEPEQKFTNIKQLIEEYEQTKINDRVKNFALKQTEQLVCGQNPYLETSRYGHFMYGDEPDCIESIKVFENTQDAEQNTTIVCEIKWRTRLQKDDEDRDVEVVLENSFMDSKTINEFRPDFLIKCYQKMISLNVK